MTNTHDIAQLARTLVLTCQYFGPGKREEAVDRATRLLSSFFQSQADAIERLEREWDEAAVERGFEFAVRWAWRDSPASDTERLSAIKYHPDVKARAEALGYPAAKEGK